ncbi:hypothetical protein [Streptomyces sp. enrichment culture]|uniref:hypothetical protein n=1 Tax=Streptomyces sp. enrichment culture TaxID=1795815 RepID=UPI003F55FDB2
MDEVESAYRTLATEVTKVTEAAEVTETTEVTGARGTTGAPGAAGAARVRPEPFQAVSEGAADAYRWALARKEHGPVTGAPTHDVPDLWRLTAEADAAAVLLDDPVYPPDKRAYVRGVHDALAWLCGQSDEHAV